MKDEIVFIKDPGQAYLTDKMGDASSILQAARISIGGQSPLRSDEELLSYLWEKGHSSPFEHATATFLIECPLFVSRHLMRHRTFSFSEVSGRYTNLNSGYYIPIFQKNSKKGEPPLASNNSENKKIFKDAIREADRVYNHLLAVGIHREQARMVLPLSTFTTFYMTGNFLNWMKFLKLRMADGVQYETWAIANDIKHELMEFFPRLNSIIMENVHGTESNVPESRNFTRAVQEGRLRRESSENSKDSSSHGKEIS